MARYGITYEDVSNAARELIAQGKNPTIETVRHILGTGSNSTLSIHLKQFKTSQAQSIKIANKEQLPEELIAVVRGLWSWVMDKAQDTMLEHEKAVNQQLSELQIQLKSLEQTHNQLQQTHHQLDTQHQSTVTECKALNQLLVDNKSEITKLQHLTVSLEQQLNDKNNYISELIRQNKQVQDNLEHYRKASHEQRLADQQRFQQEIQYKAQEVMALQTEITSLIKQKEAHLLSLQKITTEYDALNAQFNQNKLENDNLLSTLTKVRDELLITTQAKEHWHKESIEFQAKNSSLSTELIQAKAKQQWVSEQLATSQTQIEELNSQLNLAAHDKIQLKQENAQLYGQLKQLEKAMA